MKISHWLRCVCVGLGGGGGLGRSPEELNGARTPVSTPWDHERPRANRNNFTHCRHEMSRRMIQTMFPTRMTKAITIGTHCPIDDIIDGFVGSGRTDDKSSWWALSLVLVAVAPMSSHVISQDCVLQLSPKSVLKQISMWYESLICYNDIALTFQQMQDFCRLISLAI